jgi:hypothetical protein
MIVKGRRRYPARNAFRVCRALRRPQCKFA